LPKGERQPGQPQVHRRLERVLPEHVEADIRREQLLRTLPAMPPGCWRSTLSLHSSS
jgi:hypothetical protein